VACQHAPPICINLPLDPSCCYEVGLNAAAALVVIAVGCAVLACTTDLHQIAAGTLAAAMRWGWLQLSAAAAAAALVLEDCCL
jgi:hypothetical protein